MSATLRKAWLDDDGQDVAEYAVMLAVILVIVAGSIRLIGSNANCLLCRRELDQVRKRVKRGTQAKGLTLFARSCVISRDAGAVLCASQISFFIPRDSAACGHRSEQALSKKAEKKVA
jgi:Flp pilus assembly pilin Flp